VPAGASDVYLVMARCQGKLPSSTEAATAAAEDTAAAADAAAGGSSSSGSSGPLPPGVPLPPAPADGDVSAKPAAAPADSAGEALCVLRRKGIQLKNGSGDKLSRSATRDEYMHGAHMCMSMPL
jgi:hypothetical protein